MKLAAMPSGLGGEEMGKKPNGTNPLVKVRILPLQHSKALFTKILLFTGKDFFLFRKSRLLTIFTRNI